MTVSRNRPHHAAPRGRPDTTRRTGLLLLSGILLSVVPALPASARDAPMGHLTTVDHNAAHIAEAAQRFGVPVAWIRAVMYVESRGNERAISPVGAMGLMQIMPATWSNLRVRHGLGNDPFDPHDNILAGTAYLREMYDRYGSPGFLAAYNAGPGRYEKSLAGALALPAETRAYVAMLAPSISNGELGETVVTPTVARISWTAAPLFVARSERTSDARPAQQSRPTDALSIQDLSAIAPQENDLFVVRSGSGGL